MDGTRKNHFESDPEKHEYYVPTHKQILDVKRMITRL